VRLAPGNLPVHVALALLPFFAVSCKKASPEHAVKRSIPSHYVEGSFIVRAQSDLGATDVTSLSTNVAKELGCTAKAPTKVYDGTASDGGGVLAAKLDHIYNLSFADCDFSKDGTQAIVEKLAGTSGVLSAEAEAIAAATPIKENDPDKKYQGHLQLINRDAACAIAEHQGAPVVVAVVDTGVDITHPDLQNSLYRDAQGQVIGANFVDTSGRPDRDFEDQNGHGTHVAGLIAASSNNGIGVVGVAGCANVKIMPVRVLGSNGSGTSVAIDKGIEWAANHGAQIINLSLGYTAGVTSTDEFDDTLYDSLADNNIMVFAAAGNDGAIMGQSVGRGAYQYSFPSSFNHVVAVAATNDQGQLAPFSNRGDRVLVAAPGVNDLSTLRGGDYGRMSGTSMATPVAAGSYALALATALDGIDPSVGRVDTDLARSLLLKATRDDVPINPQDVQAGGVIDVQKLVQLMAARFPKHDQQPT